jgi:hypothetical protein
LLRARDKDIALRRHGRLGKKEGTIGRLEGEKGIMKNEKRKI